MIDHDKALERLEWCRSHALLANCEVERLTNALRPNFVFGETLQVAESVHAHIKTRDADAISENLFASEGATIHYRKPGFVKFQFGEGINLIFSSIAISQDDLRDGTIAPEKNFLDHIGIDLRMVTREVEQLFDSLPAEAIARGWGHASQGSPEKPVYCCHIEVGRKHWIYPNDRFTDSGARAMPLEFSLGELKINKESSGCDLRPSDPRYHAQRQCAESHK